MDELEALVADLDGRVGRDPADGICDRLAAGLRRFLERRTGEPAEEMYAMTDLVTNILPKDKPRYLMGVGTPENLLECIALGIDMFDCVLPTRNARHGLLYTPEGIVNIRNQKWKDNFEPIDPDSPIETSRKHSRSYLRHLFVNDEILGMKLASLQNLGFYLWLVKESRKRILDGTFAPWKQTMVEKVRRKL